MTSIKIAISKLTGTRHNICEDFVIKKQGNLTIHTEGVNTSSEYGLMIVCDGAGSKQKAEIGAKIAAECTAEYLIEEFEWKSFNTFELDRIKEGLLSKIIGKFNTMEGELSDYASTLLFVLYFDKSRRYLSGHIGDGAIIHKNGDDIIVLSAPENGEFKNETFFLTDKNAEKRLRMKSGTMEENSGFLICSDGVSEKLCKITTSQTIISPVCGQFFDWLQEADIDEVEQALEYNLEKYFAKENGGDDMSIGVLIN